MLEQQEDALKQGNTSEALSLLKQMREVLDRQNAWRSLRQEEPDDYDELLGKLSLSLKRRGLHQSEQTLNRQLIEIFEWCEQQGFSVEELRPKDNLHKYREATAVMLGIINDEDQSDEQKRAALTKTLKRIQEQDVTRDDTRAWARTRRDGKS